MSVEIVGRVPEERRPALERTLAVAMRELALEDLTVHVVDDDRVLPADVAAGAGLEGIWIRSWVLRGNAVAAAASVLEEAAHFKLLTLGGRTDGRTTFAGALIQEFFATWFACSQVQPFVDDQEDGFDFGPIPIGLATPELGYVLGSTLGAAVAGADPCQRRIERWQEQAVTDLGVTRLVARLRRAAAGQPTASQLAAELVRMYPAIA